MVRKAGLLLLVLLWGAAPVAAQQWAREMFETTSHDFGTLARHAQAEHQFAFKNLYIEDVHVASARVSCGCTKVKVINPSLKTYQRGAIAASINTAAFSGQRGATITVTFDQPFPATVELQVKCNIRTEVSFQPGGVEFGDVDQGTPKEQTVTVKCFGRPNWKILHVKSANPFLSAEVVQTRTSSYDTYCDLKVRLNKEAPVGYIQDHLVLVTNDQRLTNIPVLAKGRVVPAITVSPETLFLGVVHPGDEVVKQVVVRGKQPFRVTAVTSDEANLQLSTSKDELPRPLHVIPITFIAGDQTGKVVQKIRIQTDFEAAAPEVSTFAVVEP